MPKEEMNGSRWRREIIVEIVVITSKFITRNNKILFIVLIYFFLPFLLLHILNNEKRYVSTPRNSLRKEIN